jgi:hypothetical protein
MKKYTPEYEKILTGFYEHMNHVYKLNSSRVIWEFLRNAPCFEMFQLENIGMWFENSQVVTVARLLSPWPGSITIDNKSIDNDLFRDVIGYAENTFYGIEEKDKYLIISINENSDNFKEELTRQNYQLLPNEYGTLCFSFNHDIPSTEIPPEFKIKTLAEVFDFNKLNKLLWEGFQYEGAIPNIDDEIYLPLKHAWSNYNQAIAV